MRGKVLYLKVIVAAISLVARKIGNIHINRFSFFNFIKKFQARFMLALVAIFPFVADVSAETQEREISYCLKRQQALPTCNSVKALKIPYAYFSSDPGKSDQLNTQTLEVEYPSMKPWSGLSYFERWQAQKVEITLRSISRSEAEAALEVAFLGNPKPVRKEPLYGLDQYVKEGWGKSQILVKINPSIKIYIHCAFTGASADDSRLGCEALSNTEWGLSIGYRYKRKLLPEWSELNNKVNATIDSFTSANR